MAYRLRRQFRGAAADLSGAIAETILGENERRAAERICFDDVRTGFQVFAVNPENHIGPREIEVLVAAFEVRATEIRGGQVLLLQHGAHRAIQYEDALAEKFAKGEALLNQVLHVANSIFSRVQRNRGVLRQRSSEDNLRLRRGPEFYAASERNSTLKDDGTRPMALPRSRSSRTARRPSSP